LRKPLPNANNPWTPTEDDQLRAMAVAGKSVFLIAARHKRSVAAIKARAAVLGVSLASMRTKRPGRARDRI
jgi:hypothetical protein